MKLLKPKLNPHPTLASLDSLLNSLLKLSLLESSEFEFIFFTKKLWKPIHFNWSSPESGLKIWCKILYSRCSVKVNQFHQITVTSGWISFVLTGEFFIIVYPNSINKSSSCISGFFRFFFINWFLLQKNNNECKESGLLLYHTICMAVIQRISYLLADW